MKANLRKIKIAFLGDNSTQLIRKFFEKDCEKLFVDFSIYESDFDQIDQQIFFSQSDLYKFLPNYIVLLISTEKLLDLFYMKDSSRRTDFASNQIQKINSYLDAIKKNLNAKIIISNLPSIDDGIFGNYGNKVKGSFLFQIRELNYFLAKEAQKRSDFHILDIAAIQSHFGYFNRIEPKFYYSSKMTFSVRILPKMVNEISNIILAIEGIRVNKCLILDLDHTLWGGVIGDDGIDGIELGILGLGKVYTDLQNWALELKNRGIIICICSKNTEHIAKEPFEKHPDMRLRLEDISVFVANWENKADNIRYIKEVLNIGYDSMVFLDDNPFERNLVRIELPKVTVPELPEDPAKYMSFLRSQNLFETASHSEEDNKRTQRYQEEAKRKVAQKIFKSIEGYLESLNMVAHVGPFDNFSLPRVAQLTQRSNQFNLRTIRYTEEEINRIMEDDTFITTQIKLSDKYGEYGMIGLIIGKQQKEEVFIDTWIMSCRVLKRDVEKFALNKLVETSRIKGATKLIGEYLPTKKNIIVKDHYKNLGFDEKNGLWVLDLKRYEIKKTYIKDNTVNLA